MGLHKNNYTTAMISALCAVSLLMPSTAFALTKMSGDNVNVEQPAIPGSSKNRTQALKKTFDGNIKKYFNFSKMIAV